MPYLVDTLPAHFNPNALQPTLVEMHEPTQSSRCKQRYTERKYIQPLQPNDNAEPMEETQRDNNMPGTAGRT
jgi:hypothetical protein